MTARGPLATILAAAFLTIACGGSSSSPTSIPAPTPAPTPKTSPPAASDAVTLDDGNFAQLVIASGWPCLVEFHLPT